jgi:hypothetical protein
MKEQDKETTNFFFHVISDCCHNLFFTLKHKDLFDLFISEYLCAILVAHIVQLQHL